MCTLENILQGMSTELPPIKRMDLLTWLNDPEQGLNTLMDDEAGPEHIAAAERIAAAHSYRIVWEDINSPEGKAIFTPI